MGSKLTFNELVASIQEVHEQFAAQASKAVNVSLTLRNWAIGCYLREYEQRGSDRATYGKLIVERLADELQSSLDRCYTGRYIRLCRQLYEIYPQIRKSLISKFGRLEYALAGMDNHLFVSKYQLELPKKEEMQRFIEEQIKEAGDGE
ncbi:MAG: hypothetical protein DDT29_01460 [Dehalococcoidia bacterium]|nr:hypothetical protein [Bacillota bacterium]